MRVLVVLLATEETVGARVLKRPNARGVRLGALVAKAWAEIEQRAAVQNIRTICIVGCCCCGLLLTKYARSLMWSLEQDGRR
jgi:hypothetical protein